MFNLRQGSLKFTVSLVLIALTYILAFQLTQNDFYPLMLSYGLFFSIYLFIYYQVNDRATVYFFIGLAVLLRCLVIGAPPNLSDDIYRFIWDGRLINQGINPFNNLPSYYLTEGVNVPGINQALYDALNSQNYFTIYPPICQGIFAFACYLFPTSIAASTFLMKLFLFGFELGSIFLLLSLLRHFQLPLKRALLYALNPLIILEICGNLHFEGAMVFFLLLAYYAYVKDHLHWSAVAMALSIASKLLPLMFLPLFIRRLGWPKSIRYFFIVGICLLLLFFPIVNGLFFSNFGESLNLYFQRFEFNASLYYLARWLGYQYIGYNMIAQIGPALALLSTSAILALAFFEPKPNKENLPRAIMFAICFYLLCTTTVHPWYLSIPLVCCLFTHYRFPVIWSGLIFLSYSKYIYPDSYENLWIVGLEYSLVLLFFLYEWKRRSRSCVNT
ncbi:MAG: hypothetical protein AB8G15_00640 [Saprospiraceae bacterium]